MIETPFESITNQLLCNNQSLPGAFDGLRLVLVG